MPNGGYQILQRRPEEHAIFRELFASTFDREPGFEVVAQAGALAEARGVLEGVDEAAALLVGEAGRR